MVTDEIAALCLTFMDGEAVQIGDISAKVVRIKHKEVRIVFIVPKRIKVTRLGKVDKLPNGPKKTDQAAVGDGTDACADRIFPVKPP